MSELKHGPRTPRRRRADAEQNRTAILEAAVRVLGRRRDAGLDEVADAASVSRQTVYAHYSGRAELISAVLHRVTDEVVGALDAADLAEGPATEALLRLIDTTWRMLDHYPLLLHPDLAGHRPQESHERHQPVLTRLHRLIERGQASGEFDPAADPAWLAAATVALGHAAAEEAGTGRASVEQAQAQLHTALLRVYGVTAPETGGR